MSFLKKIFQKDGGTYVDKNGIYQYVECGKCGNVMRIRIDKQYDIGTDDDGSYIWRKTLVCDSCYQKMQTKICFGGDKQTIVSAEIHKGKYVDPPAESDI